MATDLVMNGVTYNGTPIANLSNPHKPSGLKVNDQKIGVAHVKADGGRSWMQRVDGSNNPIHKRTWEVEWARTTELTRAALSTLNNLTTTWTFVDHLGASYVVQTEEQDLEVDYAGTDMSNAIWYRIKLTIREA